MRVEILSFNSSVSKYTELTLEIGNGTAEKKKSSFDLSEIKLLTSSFVKTNSIEQSELAERFALDKRRWSEKLDCISSDLDAKYLLGLMQAQLK